MLGSSAEDSGLEESTELTVKSMAALKLSFPSADASLSRWLSDDPPCCDSEQRSRLLLIGN
jgi:hypothetical protein